MHNLEMDAEKKGPFIFPLFPSLINVLAKEHVYYEDIIAAQRGKHNDDSSKKAQGPTGLKPRNKKSWRRRKKGGREKARREEAEGILRGRQEQERREMLEAKRRINERKEK